MFDPIIAIYKNIAYITKANKYSRLFLDPSALFLFFFLLSCIYKRDFSLSPIIGTSLSFIVLPFFVGYIFFILAKIKDIYIDNKEKKMPLPKLSIQNPYLISYLINDSSNDTTKIAINSLLQRQLLEIIKPDKLKTCYLNLKSHTKYLDLEKNILDFFKKEQLDRAILADDGHKKIYHEYNQHLTEKKLIYDKKNFTIHILLYTAYFCFALELYILYMFFTLYFTFLNPLNIIMFFTTLLCIFIEASTISKKNLRISRIGSKVVQDLQTLFTPILNQKDNLDFDQDANKIILLMAIFGVSIFSSHYNLSEETHTGCGGSGCGGGCGGCGG